MINGFCFIISRITISCRLKAKIWLIIYILFIQRWGCLLLLPLLVLLRIMNIRNRAIWTRKLWDAFLGPFFSFDSSQITTFRFHHCFNILKYRYPKPSNKWFKWIWNAIHAIHIHHYFLLFLLLIHHHKLINQLRVLLLFRSFTLSWEWRWRPSWGSASSILTRYWCLWHVSILVVP